MKPKHGYLILAIAGIAVPYYFLGAFLLAHGPDLRTFVHQIFASEISTFFALDLVIASVVFVRFLRREANRYSIDNWWLYLLALLAVGLSFALPLFLYVRESRRDRMRSPSALHQEHP